MSTKLLVLDFDGTMTDAEAEGAPFRAGYLGDIAGICDLPYEEVDALARRFEAKVAANPESYGWLFNGRIVAPATVDPYLRMMPVAREILKHAGRLQDETDQAHILEAVLYKYNYQKTLDVSQPGADVAFRAMAGHPVYVVTNSHTAAVQGKIRALGRDGDLDWLVDRVYGRAKKYFIDDSFDVVPEALSLPGLERPVLLRRRFYYEVLNTLRLEMGAEWSEVAVCGDIFELDLALPLAMGARVGLMVNEFTPPWERAYLEAEPRGTLVHGVNELMAFAGW